jgi:PAS domain S-box-containing protein
MAAFEFVRVRHQQCVELEYMLLHMSSSPDITRIVDTARGHEADGDAVIATDAQGKIVYWNAGAESLYGWTPADALGRNIVDLTPTRTNTDEAMHIMEQLRRGESWSGDFILRHRDGRPIYAHVTDLPVLDEKTVIGVVGISRRPPRHSRP